MIYDRGFRLETFPPRLSRNHPIPASRRSLFPTTTIYTPNTLVHMAKLEVLTLSSLTGLVNARGAYLLGYSWLFGMCELLRCFTVHETHTDF